MRWLAILLVPLLAGCLGNDSDTNEATLPDVEDALDLPVIDYQGCDEHMSVVAIPVGMVDGELAEGFEPVTFDPVGALAQLFTVSMHCQLGNETATELMAGVVVNPPAEYADEDAFSHVWMLGGWASSDQALAAYEAWGVDGMLKGDVDMMTQETPAARLGNSHAGDADFAVDIDTAVVGEELVQHAAHARVFYTSHDENVTEVQALLVTWNESKSMEGVGQVRLNGGQAPMALEGIGVHNWGDDYFIRIEALPLEI